MRFTEQVPHTIGRTVFGKNINVLRPRYTANVHRAAIAGISTLGTMANRYFRGKKRFRSGRSRSSRPRKRMRMGSRAVTSGRGVTTQHDSRRIYTKSRMPIRKRKRWSAFVRKVNAVDERELGSRTVVLNNQVVSSAITQNQQILVDVALYPLKSTSAHFNDLYLISQRENVLSPTAALGSTVDLTTKIMFHSGVMDLTVRNTSNDGAPVEPAQLIDCPLEVDVYEMTLYAGENDLLTTYGSLITYINNGSSIAQDLGGIVGTSSLDLYDRGVTPWDIPSALSKFRMKILKKTKYFLNSGQTFTYQMRDPKRRVSTFGKLAASNNVNMAGWTKYVLFIAKPVPGFTIVAPTKPELSIGLTRKYLYKVEGIRDTRDYYLKV